MRGLLQVGDSADRALYKSPEKIGGSDEGFDTDLLADPNKNEDQTEKNWAPWVQSACAKASVFALV